MARLQPSPSLLRLLRAPSTTTTAARLSLLPSTAARASSSFQSGPSPPRLPADQQAEFERLQRASAERLGVVDVPPPSTTPTTSTSRHTSTPDTTATAAAAAAAQAATSSNEGVWRGAPPEFEGERNPKTGEVGGPKNEPLRWGSAGDWSYNGRVTDF